MHLRPTAWSRLSVRPMAVAVAASAALLLSGCSEFSPQSTQLHYVPSDGAQGDIGAVGIRNALLITGTPDQDAVVDPDAAANFVATFTNTGDSEATVDLSTTGGAQTSVPVPAEESVQVSPEAEQQWEVEQVGAVPGQTVPVTITVAGRTLELQVPVLDGTLPEYSTLTPAGPAPGSPGADDGPTATAGSSPAGPPTASPTATSTGDGTAN